MVFQQICVDFMNQSEFGRKQLILDELGPKIKQENLWKIRFWGGEDPQ